MHDTESYVFMYDREFIPCLTLIGSVHEIENRQIVPLSKRLIKIEIQPVGSESQLINNNLFSN